MLTLTCAGSVGTLPVRGGLTGLLAFSAAGYWQWAPGSAGAANGGSPPGAPGAGGAPAAGVLPVGVEVEVDAVVLPESRLVMTTVATTPPITTIALTTDPTMVRWRRRRAFCA